MIVSKTQLLKMVQSGGFLVLLNTLSSAVSIMNLYAKELKNMDPRESKNKSLVYIFLNWTYYS